MCNPALAVAAISMVGTGVQIHQNNQAAEDSAENAHDALMADYDLLDLQQDQINDAAAQDKLERERQGMRDQAKIRVANSEAGTLGNSALMEMHNSMFQTSYDQMIMERNRDGAIKQAQAGKGKANVTYEGRKSQAKSRMTSSALAGLKIASSGTDGYARGQNLEW
ncbi:hypothetical protein ACFL6N_07490 [Thermodesulfobacteriota bacterium]